MEVVWFRIQKMSNAVSFIFLCTGSHLLANFLIVGYCEFMSFL